MPNYFGTAMLYREPKSNSDAADLPRYRYAGLGSRPYRGLSVQRCLSRPREAFAGSVVAGFWEL